MKKMARTWWGEKFLDALASCMDIGRLTRGRAYSSPYRLLKFQINDHGVSAKVRGNISSYFEVYEEPRYNVTVSLFKFSTDDWKGIANDISQHAAILSQLMLNEMPTDIEKVFNSRNLRLLPRNYSDIISHCSCPDYAPTCKHVAGVYYKIASLLDRDPLLLFQLRGMQFDKLREILASSELGQALLDRQDTETVKIEQQSHLYPSPSREPMDNTDLKSLWQGTQSLVETEYLKEGAVTPAVLVKKGGALPGFWYHDLSLVEMMEPIYERIVDKNRHLI